jgi:membrane-bound lytic murein transglycosylase F
MMKLSKTDLMKKHHLLSLVLFVLLSALFAYKLTHKALPNVQKTKTLLVITSNGLNTYYVKNEGEYAGFEYDLVNLFAKDLGPEYSVKIITADHLGDVIPKLTSGKAHIAAANLSVTPDRAALVKFGPAYLDVQQHIAYNSEQNSEPKDISSLISKHIHVPKGSSYGERLNALQARQPMLSWQEVETDSTDELIEQVNMGLLDYTVADDRIIDILQNFYPNIHKGIALGSPEQLAWAFPQNGDPWLYGKSVEFFKRIRTDGTLKNLVDRYYGHTERLDPVDVSKFLELTHTKLPKYIPLFKQAQELTDIDWRLIAAISYQESHWDQYNTSPTNVRGLMMLTEQTADALNVTDRLDAKQSIMGGARYINILKQQVPESIPEPDRTWMALAAYNIGFAHLEDARVLAKRMKLNPDSWADIKTTLPLLNKAKYFSTVKFGYASGGAPVIFVEAIRNYYDILEKYLPAHHSVLPNFEFKPFVFKPAEPKLPEPKQKIP